MASPYATYFNSLPDFSAFEPLVPQRPTAPAPGHQAWQDYLHAGQSGPSWMGGGLDYGSLPAGAGPAADPITGGIRTLQYFPTPQTNPYMIQGTTAYDFRAQNLGVLRNTPYSFTTQTNANGQSHTTSQPLDPNFGQNGLPVINTVFQNYGASPIQETWSHAHIGSPLTITSNDTFWTPSSSTITPSVFFGNEPQNVGPYPVTVSYPQLPEGTDIRNTNGIWASFQRNWTDPYTTDPWGAYRPGGYGVGAPIGWEASFGP